MKRIDLPLTPAGYKTFIRAKRLATYRVRRDEDAGTAWVETDEADYARVFGADGARDEALALLEGVKTDHLMDFQRVVVERALREKRFADYLDCGLGKTPINLAFAHAVASLGRVLYLCPLAVFEQTQRECQRFHGHRLVDLRAREPWTDGIALLNFESMRDVDTKGLAGIVLDEASILKNADGQTRQWLCGLATGVPYRLAASATPAPNDQSEYASQAVFLGLIGSAKEFWSRFFRKEDTVWRLRGHATIPFYRYLASWAIYIQSPAKLGFQHTTELAEPPLYRIESVPVHEGWAGKTERLFQGADSAADRPLVFGEIRSARPTPRTDAIQSFAEGHRTLSWAARNAEESTLAKVLGELGDEVAVINGAMPIEQRVEMLDAFRAGQVRHVVSKAKVLGFGVNLPEVERMIYSGFDYSFESFYQGVRRAHRYGRKGRLEVLIPCTPPERPILDVLQAKLRTFERDILEVQSRFAEANA